MTYIGRERQRGLRGFDKEAQQLDVEAAVITLRGGGSANRFRIVSAQHRDPEPGPADSRQELVTRGGQIEQHAVGPVSREGVECSRVYPPRLPPGRALPPPASRWPPAALP